MENISISDNFVQQAQEWLISANLSLPASLAGQKNQGLKLSNPVFFL